MFKVSEWKAKCDKVLNGKKETLVSDPEPVAKSPGATNPAETCVLNGQKDGPVKSLFKAPKVRVKKKPAAVYVPSSFMLNQYGIGDIPGAGAASKVTTLTIE